MTEPVGVALIGLGHWGQRIAAAVGRVPGLRLAACYSRNPQSTQAAAAQLGCQAAPSFEAALEAPGVEAVLLVTPNHVHAEQALAAAQAGKHVFVEKPIAATLAEGQAMDAACRAAGVCLLVGHGFRRLGAARRVKELIGAGTLGQPVLAEANFSLPGSLTPDRWRYWRATCPGGPLMQLGIHHADTLQYWLGPAVRAQGASARLATPAEIDDVGVAQVTFASGAIATLASSYVSPKTFSLRVSGTEGVVEYDTDMAVWPRAEQMDAATRLTLRTRQGAQPVPFEARDMLADELDEFARCVRGQAVPETGAAEGLAALGLILGALEAHARGPALPLAPARRAAAEAG